MLLGIVEGDQHLSVVDVKVTLLRYHLQHSQKQDLPLESLDLDKVHG